MDKQQYFAITAIMQAEGKSDTDRLSEINQILGINVNDPNEIKALKEKVIGYDTIVVTQGTDQVTVSFAGREVSASLFGIAFLTILLNEIGSRAIDKFLPEPEAKVEKTKSASKRDGNASPASDRRLPIRNGASY